VIRLHCHDIVRNLTFEYAEKVMGNVDDLEIRFSNHLKYANAKCFPFRRMIVYNNKYIHLNEDNIEALRYTVVEECAHLRFLHHTEEFYNLCIELGCDVRTPPDGILFYWKYFKTCENCGNTKFYYHKPRKDVCNKCGSSSMQIIESGF